MATDWAPKAGEDAYWTYGEKGIVVTVKTVPKDANANITVVAPNGREVQVPRDHIQEAPSAEELVELGEQQRYATP